MKAIDRIGLKIERADKHVRDLNTALDTFYATNPCGIAKKIDSQTREPIYYVSRLADIPTSISIIAGDVLNNLRSALDHLAYSLVAVGTGKTLSKQVSFPIADSAAQYKSIQFRRKIEGAGQDPIKRLDALKPYKGGNDTLWHLGQLNNIDKHRLLLTASTRYTFRSMTLNDYARMLITHPKLDPQWSSQKRPCVVTAKPAMHESDPGRDCSTLPPVEEASLFLCASFADRI